MAEKHFYEQKEFTRSYLLPYFQKNIPNFHKAKVLEVGCAEGGLMDLLLDLGMDALGIEISQDRVNIAKSKNPSLEIFVGDITDPELPQKIGKTFDVVIMREVIEHVSNKSAAFKNLNALTNDNGFLFISFPPKLSPFAGHQQIAKSFLKMIPYLHLLPKNLLKTIAKSLGEKEDYVDEIKLHYSTGMKINDFELLCMMQNFQTVKKDLFLFRPIYVQRFGLPSIKLPGIPVLREFISFGCEVLLRKKSFNK